MARRSNSSDTYDLRKRAILVKVSTKILGITKKDEATAKAAQRHNADEDLVSVVKTIINGKNSLYKKIKKIKGVIRNYHLSATGAWQDDGFRIIATKRYAQWLETVEALIAEFNEAVEEFVGAYADLKLEAQVKLGDLFDESLYPSEDAVRRAFSVVIETEVLPDRTNTIIDLDQERTDKIVADAKSLDEKRTKILTEETHKTIRSALENMVEKLETFGDENPGKKRDRSFKDSLVGNMATLADALPGLNITGDPKLDKLAQKIAAKLTVVEAEGLRGKKRSGPGDKRPKARREAEAAKARETVTEDAKEILDDLNDVFGSDADAA